MPGAFLGIFSSFFAWQLDAVPVQVGYRSGLRALVVGNLYDPACSVWAQTFFFEKNMEISWG